MIWHTAIRAARSIGTIGLNRGAFLPGIRPHLVRYVGALAIVGVAVALRLWLDPLLQGAGFAIFLTGMLLAAWVGGLGPCLIAQTLFLFAQGIWFSPEHRVHSPFTFQGIVSLVAFYSVGGIVAVLSEAWQASRNRLLAKSEEAVAQSGRLRATLSCMADGVLVTDGGGLITLMNPVAEQLTGWSLTECRGKPIDQILVIRDEQTQEPVDVPVQSVLRKQQVLHEAAPLSLMRRDGGQLPVSYSVAPIRDGERGPSGIVLIVCDETERRRSERALQEADRRKDEFLATLAHELRNPLAPICMGLELVKSSPDDSESLTEILDMMDRQARHMVRLVDDLLDVSRITRGKLELRCRQVAIAEIVRNAVDAAQPAIKEAGHRLLVDLPQEPLLVHADPNRMTQVLTNLLDNAAKYTPHGGSLKITAERVGDEAAVTVADNGYGIAADKLETIFEMFMQVRSTMEGGHKGLGIGLTLVKQLVHMHHGTVEAQSDGPGRGSRFRVRLPAAARQSVCHRDGAPSLPAVSNGASRRVLVVDDNADALRLLTMLVRQVGSEVYQANDGLAAIEAAERWRPDVVLMDIGMPRLNGYEAARRIRQESWGEQMTLIATTGWGQQEDRQRTKEAGFDLHLVKPVDAPKLREVLTTAVPAKTAATLRGVAADPPRTVQNGALARADRTTDRDLAGETESDYAPG